MSPLLIVFVILFMKAGMDVLFLGKIDAYNRSNKLYYILVTFIETAFGILGLSIVLNMVNQNGKPTLGIYVCVCCRCCHGCCY